MVAKQPLPSGGAWQGVNSDARGGKGTPSRVSWCGKEEAGAEPRLRRSPEAVEELHLSVLRHARRPPARQRGWGRDGDASARPQAGPLSVSEVLCAALREGGGVKAPGEGPELSGQRRVQAPVARRFSGCPRASLVEKKGPVYEMAARRAAAGFMGRLRVSPNAAVKRCMEQPIVTAVGVGENMARPSSGLNFLFCGPLIYFLRQEEGKSHVFGHRLEIRPWVKEEG